MEKLFSATTIYNKKQMLGINTKEKDLLTEFSLAESKFWFCAQLYNRLKKAESCSYFSHEGI